MSFDPNQISSVSAGRSVGLYHLSGSGLHLDGSAANYGGNDAEPVSNEPGIQRIHSCVRNL